MLIFKFRKTKNPIVAIRMLRGVKVKVADPRNLADKADHDLSKGEVVAAELRDGQLERTNVTLALSCGDEFTLKNNDYETVQVLVQAGRAEMTVALKSAMAKLK